MKYLILLLLLISVPTSSGSGKKESLVPTLKELSAYKEKQLEVQKSKIKLDLAELKTEYYATREQN